MNENKRVFFCDVDYLYSEKSEEYDKLAGGAVYVFVKAFDVREALVLLLDDLNARYLEVREVVSVIPYNIKQEWASEEERTHYLHLYTECEKVNQLVYDDFAAYERVS